MEPREDFLRVHFGAAGESGDAGDTPASADYHYFWLRHNCDCCRHPQTGERTLCPSDVPLGVRPLTVRLLPEAGSVEITWKEPEGQHESRYALGWLASHAYAPERAAEPPPPSDLSRIEVSAGPVQIMARACFERVEGQGAAMVRGGADQTEDLIAGFEALGLSVIPTHFGRIEDLRTDNTTNQNTDQLGYTDAPVLLHSDQPFLEVPPRYQLLHCMRPADRGGESTIADGVQAARHLRSIDAHAFELLARIPVRFHRVQKEFERVLVAPVIRTEGDDVVQVRSSYFTMAPQQAPFNEMESWYRAYDRFTGLVADPRHHYRFRLEARDFLIYDNFRMLHARTGFEGPRWVRGVYFDHEEADSKSRPPRSEPAPG